MQYNIYINASTVSSLSKLLPPYQIYNLLETVVPWVSQSKMLIVLDCPPWQWEYPNRLGGDSTWLVIFHKDVNNCHIQYIYRLIPCSKQHKHTHLYIYINMCK